MSVAYSCQVPIGVGFARTAEVQVKALDKEALLGPVFAEDSFWAPGAAGSLGPFKDVLFDGLVAQKLEGELKIFHGWSNAMLSSMRQAKILGAKTIVERQSAHIRVQQALLGESSPVTEQRMIKEYSEADVILVPSRFVEESFLKADPALAPKLRRIPLGVDNSKFKRVSQFKHPLRVLFTAGNNFDRKGGLYMVKAWQIARGASKAAREGSLWIVGEAPLGDLGPGVNQLGPLAEEEYVRTVIDCDMLVLPSLEDGFGLVCLEAMAAGHPVIVSENVGAKDCITNGREGFIVPVGDAAKLAKAIVSLAESPDRRREIGDQAHRTSCRFSWEKYAESYISLVRGLL